jgi:hypothetical protein
MGARRCRTDRFTGLQLVEWADLVFAYPELIRYLIVWRN